MPIFKGNLGLLASTASSVAASSPPLGCAVRSESHSSFLLWLSVVAPRTLPLESPGMGCPTGPPPDVTSRVAGRPHAFPSRGRIIMLLVKLDVPTRSLEPTHSLALS